MENPIVTKVVSPALGQPAKTASLIPARGGPIMLNDGASPPSSFRTFLTCNADCSPCSTVEVSTCAPGTPSRLRSHHQSDRAGGRVPLGNREPGRSGRLDGVMIRPRRPSDFAACVEALAEVHRSDGYPTRWPEDPARWLDPPRLLGAWVADQDGLVVGHIVLVAGVDDAELIAASGSPGVELVMVSRLFVKPTARGQQLGQGLLRTATDFGVSHGLGLVLEVVKEPRSAAMALYERMGWRRIGERPAAWTTPSGNRPQLYLYLRPAVPPRR